MSDPLRHGPYLATIHYSAELDAFRGEVANLPPGDMVLIEGRSVDELRADFAGQIEVYERALRAHRREPAPFAYPPGPEQ